MSLDIVAPALPNMPWQDKPEGCQDVIWRYDRNPIIPAGRHPVCELGL